MLRRPWRWLIALVIAAVLMGLLNEASIALGAGKFFGLSTPFRIVMYGVFVGLLCLFVLPSQEKLERGDPLPPLPHMDYGSRSQHDSRMHHGMR